MIELEDLRDHLRLPQDFTVDDALLTGYEQAAVKAIENWNARYYGPPETVADEVYDGSGTDTIWLKEFVADPSSVSVETWDGTAWGAVDAGDYEVEGFGLYHRTSVWTQGRRNLRVTYDRGFLPGEEPPEIRLGVMQLVAHWYASREPVLVGTIVAELPMHVRALIGSHRRVLV